MIFPRVTSDKPIEGAPIVFTDGSKTGIGAYVVTGQVPVTIQFTPEQPQVVELQIIHVVLQRFPNNINLISDSNYVVNALQILETTGPIKSSSTVASLFHKIQQQLLLRTSKIFVSHIRAHTPLPGPLSEGNAAADAATRPLWVFVFPSPVEAAQRFHSQFHVNARTLAMCFNISRAQA